MGGEGNKARRDKYGSSPMSLHPGGPSQNRQRELRPTHSCPEKRGLYPIILQMESDDLIFARAQELYGKGDFQGAFQLYLALADRGRVGCRRFVGWMYFGGEGVEKDLSKAFEWFKKAAHQGDREAKFGAGRVCLLTRDDTNALTWFTLACREGFVPGCFRLGWMYLHGRGCGKDPAKAYDLLSDAYAKGHLPAGRARARLLIAGQRGLFGRLLGIFLLLRVLLEVVVTAIREPNSQRFMV